MGHSPLWGFEQIRAGDGIRTHEYHLGKVVPYHLATPAFFLYLMQIVLYQNIKIQKLYRDVTLNLEISLSASFLITNP